MIRQAQYFPAGEDAGSLRLLSFIRFSAEDITMQDKTKQDNRSFITHLLDERGSVSVEYLLLLAGLVLPVASAVMPPNGILFQAFIARYQLMLYIVSLPFP